jgi:hypothetical protein
MEWPLLAHGGRSLVPVVNYGLTWKNQKQVQQVFPRMLADLEHARSGKRLQYCSQEFAVAVAPAGERKPQV